MNEVLEQFASDKLTSCFSSWDKERQRVGGWGGEDRWMGLGMGADTSGGKYHPQEKCCWDRVAETTERTVVGKMRPYLPLEGINRWSGCWGGRLSLEWKPRRAEIFVCLYVCGPGALSRAWLPVDAQATPA